MMRARQGNPRRGFTMLELAIAIALATMIVAGLYRVFIMQSRQLAFLDTQSEMHQNLRFATDVVTRTLRVAGLGTSGNVRGFQGYPSGANDTLPTLISYNAHPYGNNTDAITIVHQDPSLMMNTYYGFYPPSGTNTLYMDVTNHPEYRTLLQSFAANELLLCFDFERSAGMLGLLWVITAVDPATGQVTVQPNSTYSDYTDEVPTDRNLNAVMTCSKGEIITFYIDNNAGDGIGPGSDQHPVLMMDLDFSFATGGPEDDDVPLVDDIEDMQIAYCLADATGTSNCDTSVEPTVTTSPWIGDIDKTQNVWMVRVSFVARSARPDFDQMQGSTRPALEDHGAASAPDHYYREVLTSTVTARNLRFYTNLASEYSTH
jgi:prepilin-type N-terminal cleavage/methylation domain-containing protein